MRAEDINAKKLAPVGLLTDNLLSDSTLKTKDVLVDKILSDSVAKEEKADNTVIDTATPKKPSRIRKEKVDLDNQVVVTSTDSLVLIGRSNVYIYGNGQVDYGEMKLDAAQIQIDLEKSEVYAVGVTDSVGEVSGNPVFEEGGSSYETKDMRYNFKSKRGFITDVITEQGEGFLTGGKTKKTEDDYYYLQDGRYTTCSDHEHPHFYFQLTRA